MIIADDCITVSGLRHILGLPAERPDGVRDLLVVASDRAAPVPDPAASPWQLALGLWPEEWQANPQTGPRYLVMLRQLTIGYIIAAIEEIDPARWGAEPHADPRLRTVPVRGPAPATVELTGCRLDLNATFGWPLREEQYAFL
jgi:hypothetical protein